MLVATCFPCWVQLACSTRLTADTFPRVRPQGTYERGLLNKILTGQVGEGMCLVAHSRIPERDNNELAALNSKSPVVHATYLLASITSGLRQARLNSTLSTHECHSWSSRFRGNSRRAVWGRRLQPRVTLNSGVLACCTGRLKVQVGAGRGIPNSTKTCRVREVKYSKSGLP